MLIRRSISTCTEGLVGPYRDTKCLSVNKHTDQSKERERERKREKEFDRERSEHKNTLVDILWCDDLTRIPSTGYETVEQRDKPPKAEMTLLNPYPPRPHPPRSHMYTGASVLGTQSGTVCLTSRD